MTATIAETATLAHGFTMNDVERLTNAACKRQKVGQALDWDERRAVAWHGVVERLYDRDEDTPTWRDLLFAGMRAIQVAADQERQFRGVDTKRPGSQAPHFSKYWLPIRGHDDFTDRIIERLTLPLMLGELTDLEYEAIATLAALGSGKDAAVALGVPRGTYQARLMSARTRAKIAWFGDETPPAPPPKDTHCRHGHARAEHGFKTDAGAWVCRLCVRATVRRARARGDR